jgi:uncharacterized membrane protein YkoI
MSVTIRVLFVLALSAGLVGVPTARADEKDKKQPTTEPAKPIIIQLDASKLPPEVLKELIKLSKSTEPTKPGKPDTKPEKPATKPVKAISLADAIAIAEKTTSGTATKAERNDEDGAVQFKIDVLDGRGGKTKVTLSAEGKVLRVEKKGDEKDEKGQKGEKDAKDGKKKKKGDDEDDDDDDKGKGKNEDKGKGKKSDEKGENKGKKKGDDEDKDEKGKNKKEKDD